MFLVKTFVSDDVFLKKKNIILMMFLVKWTVKNIYDKIFVTKYNIDSDDVFGEIICDNYLFIDPNVEENRGDVESHCLDLLEWKKCVDPVWNWKGEKEVEVGIWIR